ncbi:MAG: ComEC/Rec2 family competence protein, partial [Gemmatimonadaceae bacterium]
LIAPLANLAAAPVITVLQPTLFLALVLAPLPSVAGFVADAAHPLLRVFDGIAGAAAAVPHASVSVVPSLVTAIAGGGAVAAVIWACLSRYPLRPIMAAMTGFAVIAWSPAIRLPHDGAMEMHVLDVGQGDAVLIRTDRGRWILFDAGRVWEGGDAGRSVIVPYVMRRGGELTAFVLSHAHADHAGGAPTILQAFHPQWFWDAAFVQGSAIYDRSLRVARESGVNWKRVHPGDSLRVDGVSVYFLAPDSAWTASLSDPNDASTVALVQFGASRFLLVGDAEQEEERWLLDHDRDRLRADVLKVGHHGSATSSGEAFLAAVNPSLALISVGAGNVYGHPSTDVVAALARAGAEVARTDRDGTIVVRSDGRAITFETRRGRWDISRE